MEIVKSGVLFWHQKQYISKLKSVPIVTRVKYHKICIFWGTVEEF